MCIRDRYCIDAVVAVVNEKNHNFDNMTEAMLKAIFTGKTTLWEDLEK